MTLHVDVLQWMIVAGTKVGYNRYMIDVCSHYHIITEGKTKAITVSLHESVI